MNKQTFLAFAILGGLILDLYTFFAFKRAFESKLTPYIYWGFHFLLYTIFLYGVFFGKENNFWMEFTLISLTILYIPKIVIFFFLITEDVGRLFSKGYSSIKGESFEFPSRRKFISQIALGIAVIPFLGVLHGIIFGKYNFRVINKTLYFDDLPDAFDDFTITQISDIHSGSFDNKEKIEYAIDLINEQKSDLFLFTGDLVNNFASEMTPWIDTFKKIQAPYGKMSVMGNHDYGLYGRFSKDMRENERLREENLQTLYKIHKKIGFDLLLNENRPIVKNNQKINIIGVENWGASPYFPKKGNLKKATETIKNHEFNILMSHDPSHFDFKKALYRSETERKNIHEEKPVIEFEKKIHLTLSGHTHGAQIGIEIPGFKWSPVKYFYPKWAGLYEEAGRYLYVNRGFGFLAFPGRIGMWPEITVLKLKKKA
ncbi:MAG: metallophosphoesterase [Flavobacteriales bacterium]